MKRGKSLADTELSFRPVGGALTKDAFFYDPLGSRNISAYTNTASGVGLV